MLDQAGKYRGHKAVGWCKERTPTVPGGIVVGVRKLTPEKMQKRWGQVQGNRGKIGSRKDRVRSCIHPYERYGHTKDARQMRQKALTIRVRGRARDKMAHSVQSTRNALAALWQVALRVHAPVQDAHNLNAIRIQRAVIDDVLPGAALAVAGPDVAAVAALAFGIVRQLVKAFV